jgi:hypothetical protein
MASIFGMNFDVASLVSQIALAAATGGTSLALQTALKAVVSSIATQVIQQLGEKLGLPQPIIDMAKNAFAAATGQNPGDIKSLAESIGQLGAATGGSPAEVGQANREANDIVDKMVESILKKVASGSDEEGSSAGESRLVKLAKALGKLIDSKMDKMIEIGGKMDTAKKQGSLSAELQAVGQELSMISNALNNAIKSIGEANTTLARKS